jgi:transposase InsO family protein
VYNGQPGNRQYPCSVLCHLEVEKWATQRATEVSPASVNRELSFLRRVTAAPTAAWVCPQLREAFPDQTAPRYLLHDRAAIVSVQVRGTLTAMGSTPKRISYRRPWQNGAAEHWVGSGRRELLEHVIVLGEQHLRRLLREYLAYYHQDRSHLALATDTPDGRAAGPFYRT